MPLPEPLGFRIALVVLTLPDKVGDRFERTVAGVRCAFCAHPRRRHRHHRAGLDCGGCWKGCKGFRWLWA